MGTIKLRRGTGSPAGSLAQYEVAMDVAAQTLYVSSNGTDAVILANKYDDGDAVTAIEDASSLTLSGSVDVDSTLTTMGGFTNESGNYGQNIYANRENDEDKSGGVASIIVQRDLGTETLGGGFDSRGPAIDFNMTSDDGGLTQYQGGIQFQSNNDDGTDPEAWFRAYSWDDLSQDNIIQANKDWAYIYGRFMAQKSATLQNQNGDDEAPLVVKADWDNNDAVAAEFFNISDDDYSVSIKSGTDQGFGSLTYNNQLRSYRDGDLKYQYFDVLNDDGTFNQTIYQMSKDTNTGDVKHNMSGQVRVELAPSSTTPNTALQIQTDMSNATSDLSTGVKTNLNWGSGTIPNDAESWQEFSVQDDTQGQLKVGYFGARYKSANNGELSTMKLAALTHDSSDEAELSINQKQATATVPFKFVNMTTTQRNALSSVDTGTVIYNSTDDKLQVYAIVTGSGTWVDLH